MAAANLHNQSMGLNDKFDTGRQRCRVIPLSVVILGNAFNSETNNYPWISPWQHSPIVNGCTYTGYYKGHGEMSSFIQEGNMISYITSLNRFLSMIIFYYNSWHYSHIQDRYP